MLTKHARTRGQGSLGAELGLPLLPVKIAASLQSSLTTEEITAGTPTVIATLARAIDIIASHGTRPLLVLDDTDKWAGGLDGQVDRVAAEAFFHHGARVLAELDCDLLVAVHERFLELAAYQQSTRFLTDHVEVPRFEDPRPLVSAILERRITNEGIETPLPQLLSNEALALLEAAYLERKQDLRFMLNVSHEAVKRAAADRAPAVAREHVHRAGEDVRTRNRS